MQAAVLFPVAGLGLVWAIWGARAAFLGILVPSLLLLPAYYVWKLPGIPAVTFHNYLMAAGVAALLCAGLAKGIRPAITDVLVIAGVAWAVSSEYSNAEFHEARNLAANVGLLGLAPYAMGRLLGRSDRWLVGFIGALVLVGAMIGWASVYEARMGSNPFDFWRGRWPGDVPWDGALYRAGIRRCAGPFAHPICAGFFFSMLIPLWAWLADRELPGSRSKRALLGVGLLIGILTAVSRGPLLGAAVGVVVMRIGWSSWRVPIGAVILLGGLMGGALVADNVGKYLNVSRGDAQTESQETAAYRAEMLRNYLEVVIEEPWQGFGRYQVPVVKGQKSIDNQYLFLTLQFGLPRAVLFLLAILAPACSLMYRLLRVPVGHPRGRLGWVLLGVLVGSVGTLTTVFAGTQTAQLLLILQGVAVTTARDLAIRPARATA